NHLIDPSNRLSQWVEGGDCCEWIGVVCHNSAGHVHQLNLAPTLSEPDEFAPCFEWEAYERSKLKGKINLSLLELKHLTGSPGGIPHNLGNLSKLHYLDLGGNYLKPKSFQWVSGLSSLLYLDLSGADLSKANDWLQNSLEGPIPCYFGNISFLEVLDLTLNRLNSSIPNSLYSLNRLQFLSRSENQLQRTISRAIGNLSSITHLDLCSNFMLEGRLPTSLEYLCKLKEMDLSYEKIEDGISELLQSLSRCCLGSLESLDMADNQLSGHLTDQLGQFKNLAYLSLARNKIFGPIQLSIGELSSLKFFDVSENQLKGTFPLCFGQLESLETLDFGYNLLEGVFQKKLSVLDISDAGISDVLPTWFLNLPI
ncbi:hypothetical protein Gogos_015735, partial [Gossypium gossypioides]|nr:hypothetical protein [Gossypium gossypioides]